MTECIVVVVNVLPLRRFLVSMFSILSRFPPVSLIPVTTLLSEAHLAYCNELLPYTPLYPLLFAYASIVCMDVPCALTVERNVLGYRRLKQEAFQESRVEALLALVILTVRPVLLCELAWRVSLRVEALDLLPT